MSEQGQGEQNLNQASQQTEGQLQTADQEKGEETVAEEEPGSEESDITDEADPALSMTPVEEEDGSSVPPTMSDQNFRRYLRRNLRWLIAEMDHVKEGRSADERAKLNP